MKKNKKNSTISILRMNGYQNLDCKLQKKLIQYLDAPSKEKICLFFTWSEFCDIVANTTFIFYFCYKSKKYSVEKKENNFFLVGDDETFFEVYKSQEELQKNAKIDQKNISAIWNDILID